MRRTLIPTLALLFVGSAGCQLLPANWRAGDDPKAKKAPPVPTESVLYARDGSIVTPSGPQSAANMPRRDVQNGEGTRTKILELYERVVEERDQLRLTVSAQAGELAQLHRQLDKENARANELEVRVNSAEQSRAELSGQNLELAGRLTTAQIKRLEAEKKWLELSISQPAKSVAAVENPPLNTAPKPAVKTAAEQVEHH